MKADPAARPEFVAALAELVSRIATAIEGTARSSLPIQMYIAGGAALHLYTGARVSQDVDAVFSRRIALPDDLDVAYRDSDGSARLLYFDRQYNDTLGLLHEDAREDSRPIDLQGIDRKLLDVRLLSPLDLAVSKIGRLTSQDRDDIVALARHGLIEGDELRRRAEHAATAYVGDLARIASSINVACNLVNDALSRKRSRPRPR